MFSDGSPWFWSAGTPNVVLAPASTTTEVLAEALSPQPISTEWLLSPVFTSVTTRLPAVPSSFAMIIALRTSTSPTVPPTPSLAS